jgi:hypothetical protein
MAVTPGTGGTGTVDHDGGTIFSATAGSPGTDVTSLQVWNDGATGSAAAKVMVTGMHTSSNTGLHLNPGKTTIVRFGNGNLKECKVYSATNTSTAEVSWGVVAKTGASPM